jgi:hypothetical protein
MINASSTVRQGYRQGLLDTSEDPSLDYYLVLCGPKATSPTPKHSLRPFSITSVHLFDARELAQDRLTRGIAAGTASSVRQELWTKAEIYPTPMNPLINLTEDQANALRLFAPPGTRGT